MNDHEKKIAAKLEKHADATVEMEKSPGLGFFFVCECGHREIKTVSSKREWLAGHQTTMIAPLIVEAQSQALLDAADTLRNDPSAERGTPKYMRNLVYATWLLERVAGAEPAAWKSFS